MNNKFGDEKLAKFLLYLLEVGAYIALMMVDFRNIWFILTLICIHFLRTQIDKTEK